MDISYAALDDRMQEGYTLLEKGNTAGACDIWLGIWRHVLNIMHSQGLKTIEAIDRIFNGTQSVFNWVQDLEMELGNAGKKFAKKRISFCEQFLEKFPNEDSLIIENMRRAIADSYFELGEAEKAGNLYSQWLKDNPRWGWGWIGWSDIYWLEKGGTKDFETAEKLLTKGLLVSGLRDKGDVRERLRDLYLEAGMKIGAETKFLELRVEALKAENERLKRKFAERINGGPAENRVQPAKKIKTGHNEPCPYGSGKKFKKCCGALKTG